MDSSVMASVMKWGSGDNTCSPALSTITSYCMPFVNVTRPTCVRHGNIQETNTVSHSTFTSLMHKAVHLAMRTAATCEQ